jgi:ACS family tartrate transporter-like MFS transporter
MPDHAAAIRSKVTRRLIAPLTFLTFLNSIDRVNVSFAALQMNRELGFTPEQYGLGVSLFFVGYLACSLPHTWLLQRYGARRWIFAAVLLWGSLATLLCTIHSTAHFYVLRLLLGAAESGFAPGIVFIISQWLPQRFRASSIAGSMLAVPISMMIGAPLSGWLLTLDTGLGWPGWRFMFLVEGLITVVAACITPWLFASEPRTAPWLTQDEKRWLESELADESAATRGLPESPTRLTSLLRSPPLWAAIGVWFSLMCGTYGIIYWLPQVIKQLSGLGDFTVSLLSALPWVGLGAGLLLVSWNSDRTQERRWHCTLSALLAAAGLLGAAAFGQRAPALLCLIAGGFGLGGAQAAFWPLPTRVLAGRGGVTGITMITLFGSTGGLLAPPLIGFVRGHTGTFALPALMLAALLCCGATLVGLIRPPGSRRTPYTLDPVIRS